MLPLELKGRKVPSGDQFGASIRSRVRWRTLRSCDTMSIVSRM